ncbi:gap junction delta-4 protein [Conger conger]|uniref:gap junction delta-4 protein n=1 Tax=Conger conger TaxID=82655 RepID=UPI002A59DED8|nr:gap junction delta-4 protein [Conger conger]
MGKQSTTEVLFLALNHNITIVGKIWLVLMILLRVLVLLLAGYPLYQDEQERFVCNTIQPGCANVCYDVFSPLSLFRFWLVQLITLCLPYLVFVVHVVHKVSSGLVAEGHVPGRVKGATLYRARQEACGKGSVSRTALRTEQVGSRSFTAAYVVHLLLRIVLEAGFGVAHYYLFGFYIPKQFLCHQAPCTTTVDCYVSRPTEKMVMLNFMLGASALSFLLNFADLVCILKRAVRRRGRGETVVAKVYEEEEYYLSPSGRSVGAELPLARDLVASAAFRKRAASKSSTDEAASVRLAAPGDALMPPAPPLPGNGTKGNGTNANGNNAYVQAQEEGLEREGSDAPLCPTDVKGTPRSIRVCKHGRLKPPPPPRRDKAPSPALVPPSPELFGRRVGQYTLVEVASELQSNSSDTQEKRSEWV